MSARLNSRSIPTRQFAPYTSASFASPARALRRTSPRSNSWPPVSGARWHLVWSGYYRLRTLALRGGRYIYVEEGGAPELEVRVGAERGEVVWVGDAVAGDELRLAPATGLIIANETGAEQLFILERMVLNDQAATAAQVIAMQSFRDLFAAEALRPGERISVGSLTIVFTDLYGSTEMYNEMGDAPAFGLVLSHFDVLKEAVLQEGGAVVKTMGDAVMAVFQRPLPALRALLKAQRDLDAGGIDRFRLKVGLHHSRTGFHLNLAMQTMMIFSGVQSINH